MVEISSIDIPGPVGMLEAELWQPQQATGSAAAIVCHPHPLHSGTMNNKVVHYLVRTLTELGLPAIRFNFRGVGTSEGEYGHGRGEVDDVVAVYQWAVSNLSVQNIWLAGFSFGSYVAICAAQQIPIVAMLSIAPPVNHFDFSSLSLPRCPWLLVHGDQDEVVPYHAVQTWVNTLETKPSLVTLEGSGHFFHGRLNDLQQVVKDFHSQTTPYK